MWVKRDLLAHAHKTCGVPHVMLYDCHMTTQAKDSRYRLYRAGAGIWHGKHHQTARCGSEPVLNDALSCSMQSHTMVSGHGARGGRGRCYTLWRDFVTCLTKAGTTSMDVCQPEREDYMECLHHNKLVGALSHCKASRKEVGVARYPMPYPFPLNQFSCQFVPMFTEYARIITLW